jgi:hypothetical protein
MRGSRNLWGERLKHVFEEEKTRRKIVFRKSDGRRWLQNFSFFSFSQPVSRGLGQSPSWFPRFLLVYPQSYLSFLAPYLCCLLPCDEVRLLSHEIIVNFYQTTRHHIPDGSNLHSYRLQVLTACCSVYSWVVLSVLTYINCCIKSVLYVIKCYWIFQIRVSLKSKYSVKIQSFGDVMLCRWASGCVSVQNSYCIHLQGQLIQEE